MKQLILAALAVMTLFAGDTLAQTRPVGAPPTAPQAATAQPPAQTTPAVEVTNTMVANCLSETLAIPENAAFAASPRTQAVGASLKLAPCAGGETVRLRTVMRVDNVIVHDSAWRQVADALQTRATARARAESDRRVAERAQAAAAAAAALAPAQAEEVEQQTSATSAVVILMVISLIIGLLIGLAIGMALSNRRPKRRGPSQIGPQGEVSPTTGSTFDDGGGPVTRN